MTSIAPTHRAAPPMTHTPDPATTSQAQTVDDVVEAPTTRSRLRAEIAENPLLSLFFGLILALLTFFGTLTIGILLFFLNDINDGQDSLGERIDRVEVGLGGRIDRVEVGLGGRIDRLEAKVDAGFAEQGARIDELDARLSAQIAELDRKLTALIAHLNATGAVDAALEHRLLIPDSAATGPDGEPPG